MVYHLGPISKATLKSRALIETVIILASQEIPPFYGTLRFLTAFTKARLLYIHGVRLTLYRVRLQEFNVNLAGINTVILTLCAPCIILQYINQQDAQISCWFM